MSGFNRNPHQYTSFARDVAQGLAKKSGDTVKYVPKTGYEFSRALVTGTPKVQTYGGMQVSTVWVSTRAGLQVRQLVAYGARIATQKAPTAAYRAAKYFTKATARDVLNPYYKATGVYRFLTAARADRGVATQIERYADAIIKASAVRLNKVGLAPSFRSGFASNARLVIYGFLISSVGGNKKVTEKVQEYGDRIKGKVDETVQRIEASLPGPAATPPAATPPAPVGIAPPPPPPPPPVVVTPPVKAKTPAQAIGYDQLQPRRR